MEALDGGSCKKLKRTAAPAAEAAGDDVLGHIFLRLPDTASLARAALACKRWRRVASDPVLLCRFHSLHEPPLLGFIMLGPRPRPRGIGVTGPDHRFLPSMFRNPHIAGATAAADYLIEDFAARNPRHGALIDRWVLRGCDGGPFLLTYGYFYREDIAVYDPIARTAEHFRCPGPVDFDFHDICPLYYALVAGDADTSFRVFAVQQDMDTGSIQAAVFSSLVGKWESLPSLLAPGTWHMRTGMRAGRFVYWKSNTVSRSYWCSGIEQTAVLDTTTMEWTLIKVPFSAKESYCVADIAEHGGLCLVASKEQCVQIWVQGGDGWVIKKQIFLLKEFPMVKKLCREEWMKRVKILEVRDSYLYMEFWSIRMFHSYFLVLNCKTMKLRVLLNDADDKFRGPAFPFFMTWAPPLLSPAEQQQCHLQR